VTLWCEGHPQDLYTALPEARELLTRAQVPQIWTRGTVADGSLVAPALWHGPLGWAGFFGFDGPALPAGVAMTRPVVGCTFEEAIRACFIVRASMFLEGALVWPSAAYELLRDRTGPVPPGSVREVCLQSIERASVVAHHLALGHAADRDVARRAMTRARAEQIVHAWGQAAECDEAPTPELVQLYTGVDWADWRAANAFLLEDETWWTGIAGAA
jgi:hypothetical protein